MPKAKVRKRSNAQKSAVKNNQNIRDNSSLQNRVSPASRKSTGQVVASRMEATQGILMPAFVALGCWGLAISFLFFFPDPNHVLYGGMAAAMGLIWTIIVFLRINRATRMSREGRIYK